ncbi:MAG: GAF domain-containing protein [Rubrivivax sp.]|nr:MAG: GAF domain-containing protein [Rubrivivax sp.]
MILPDLPPNELERLEAIHALGLLDTPKEDRFDRFTRLAMAICDTPVSIVSLIDSERQWFKSCGGTAVTETPRSISFCAHAILEKGLFYVPDTLKDPRFSGNPLVTNAPFIRFYAGCPVFLPGDLPIGTLCVLDTRPRELSTAQTLRLRDLADCLQREMHLQMLMQDLNRLSANPSLAVLGKPATKPVK